MSDYGINLKVSSNGGAEIKKLFDQFKNLEKQVDATQAKLKNLNEQNKKIKAEQNALTATIAGFGQGVKVTATVLKAFTEIFVKNKKAIKDNNKAIRENRAELKAAKEARQVSIKEQLDETRAFQQSSNTIMKSSRQLGEYIKQLYSLKAALKKPAQLTTIADSITKADFTKQFRDLETFVKKANRTAFALAEMSKGDSTSLNFGDKRGMGDVLQFKPGNTERGISSYINLLEGLRGQLDKTGEEYRQVTRRILEMNEALKNQTVSLGGKSTGFSADQYGPRQARFGEKTFARMTSGKKQFQKGGLFYEPGGYGKRLSGGLNSALIGGAFPALFGQGPGASIGGGLGGGIGGMLGGGLGFGLSLVGTQVGAQLDKLVGSLKKTGDALGDFTKDFSQLKESLGLVGSATGKLMDLMAEAEGKTAAFAFAQKQLEGVVGESGVAAMKEFSDDTRKAAEAFAKVGLRMQSFVAKLVNATGVLKAIGESPKDIQKALKEIGTETAKEHANSLKAAQERWNAILMGMQPVYGNQPGEELVKGQPVDPVQAKANLDKLKAESKQLIEQNTLTKQRAYVQDILTKKLQQQHDIQQQIGYQAREELRIRQQVDSYIKQYTDKLGQAPTAEEIEQYRELIAAQGELVLGARLWRESLTEVGKELIILTDAAYQVTQAAEAIGGAFSESFKGVIKGTMSVQQAFANMFSRIADHFLDMAARMMANRMMFNLLKMWGFSSFGGDLGLGANDLSGALDGFAAEGGPVKGGGSYVVGEEGPEIFVPNSSGKIIPNDELGGGGGTSIVVNVDASGSSVEGDEEQARELGDMLAAAIQAEIVKQKRPGGLLA